MLLYVYTYSILLTEALRILRCILYIYIYIYLHSIVLLDFLFCRGVSRYFFSMCSQINKFCFQNDFCDKSPHHLCDTWKNLLKFNDFTLKPPFSAGISLAARQSEAGLPEQARLVILMVY